MAYRAKSPLAAVCVAITRTTAGALTELSASCNFLGDWSVYGTARYTRLSDEVTDSPMVDKSRTGLISTGITYKF